MSAKAVFWVRVPRGADLQGLEHIFCRVREPVGVGFWPSRSWYKLSSGYTATASSRQTVQRERGNAKLQLDVRGYELRAEVRRIGSVWRSPGRHFIVRRGGGSFPSEDVRKRQASERSIVSSHF